MEQELKKIHFDRSVIFQDIGMVEMALNKLVSLYFFNNNSNELFIGEMLQNPYFSFELRKRVFVMIFKKKYPSEKFALKDLEDMQKFRNIIAHSRIDKINEGGMYKFYYCYHTERDECSVIHEKFKTHMSSVVESLNTIKKDTGLVFKPEPPMEF